jgi:hypothetical protein
VKICIKLPQNIPNVHKITDIFHSKGLQKLPKLGFLVRKKHQLATLLEGRFLQSYDFKIKIDSFEMYPFGAVSTTTNNYYIIFITALQSL